MEIIEIDYTACTGCRRCVSECPAGLFALNGIESSDVYKTMQEEPDRQGRQAACQQPGMDVVRQDPNGWCTGCGHCICVCPANAIRFENESLPSEKEALPSEDGSSPASKTLEFEGVSEPSTLCSYDTVLKFLASKRSVRHYRRDEVPKESIEAVIEAMRYAPTGHNLQANRYLVIRDPEKIQRIIEETSAGFKRFKAVIRLRKLLKPFVSGPMYEMLNDPGLMAGLDDLISKCRAGEDPILHSAPVVVVSYYPSFGPLSLLDPTIAFTYGMLAAHALGLGTCWIGFSIQALWKNKGMKRFLGIPGDMIVTGVMTLGYPAVRYVRVPPRRAAAVKWY